MKVVTPSQMNEIDRFCIDKLGIPGIVLMENAALCVVREIIKDLGTVDGKRILVFAGKGNNGGDAFAITRHLHHRGAMMEVYTLAAIGGIMGDARVNLDILCNMGITPVELTEDTGMQVLAQRLLHADILVDGMFGTGFKGGVSGAYQQVMQLMNNSGKRIIAIDIPSGVSGETGEVCAEALKSYKTVTFGLPKVGTVIHPGCEYVGDLVAADIGIPQVAVESQDIRLDLLTKAYTAGRMPRRFNNSNKGNFGKVFVVTGSTGMTGAGFLAGKAALRSGAGLVYLGVPSSLAPIYDAAVVETVTLPLEDHGKGYLAKACIAQLAGRLPGMSVLAAGPGLSVNEDIMQIIAYIIENAEIPLVLDADALNALSKNVSVLSGLKVKAVITPHPGEMARLAGITIQDVQNNRIKVAREFAVKWKVITVLKGARTIIACPDGSAFINSTGNSGMATAGTGDVLTGMIAGLIGQGVQPEDAAAAGVYLHGAAGDAAAEEKGLHGLIAGDLIEYLPYVMKEIAAVNNFNRGVEADEGKRDHVD